MLARCVLTAVALLLIPAGVHGQSYLIHTYGVEDGLPSSEASSVIQRPDGTIWALTARGVVHSGGLAWQPLGAQPRSLSGRLSGVLRLAADGGLWLASPEPALALQRWDGTSWAVFPAPEGTSEEEFAGRAFAVGATTMGTVVALGTASGELLILSPGARWDLARPALGLPAGPVRSLAWNGGRFVVASAAGIAEIEPEPPFRTTVRWRPPAGELPLAATPDPQRAGTIWVLTTRSLLRVSPDGTVRRIAGVSGRIGRLSGPHVLLPHPSEGVFFGDDRRLWRTELRSGALEEIGTLNGLAGNGARDATIDREGNLWTATSRGLSKLVSLRFATFRRKQGLLEDEVTAVEELGDGRLVLGHPTGLSVSRPDGGWTVIPFSRPVGPPLDRTRVLDLARGPDGSVWVAASELGLGRIRPSGRLDWVWKPPAGFVYAVLPRPDGSVLFSGAAGILLWRNGRTSRPGWTGELPPAWLYRRLIEGPSGRVLGAGVGGFVVVERGHAFTAEIPDNPAARNLYAAWEDPDGTVWAGGLGGLFRLEGRRLVPAEIAALRDVRPVYFIVRPAGGPLWLGTGNGVIRWDGRSARRYTTRHGFAAVETNRDAAHVDHRGHLWLGGDRGVSVYAPGLDWKAPPPVVHLTTITGPRSEHPVAQGLRLGPAPAAVRFGFDVTSWVDETGVLLSAWLEGLAGGSWQELPASANEATFAALPAGRYRLHLRAANVDGVPSPERISPWFTVRPPLWRTWWFSAVAGLALLGAGLLAAALLLRVRYTNLLQRDIRQKTAELCETEERYGRLFELAAEPLLVFDPEARQIVDGNGAARELLDERSGRSPFPLPIDRIAWLTELLDAPAQNGSEPVRLIAADGSSRSFDPVASPIAIDGRPHVMVTLHELTERERLEAERVRASKLESLGLLAGGIAHDFNNILAAAMGNVSLAQIKEARSLPIGDSLDAAERALRRGRGLTTQLLTFAKGGAPVRALTDLGDLVRETTGFVLAGSSCTGRIEEEGGLWPANVDADQIAQVIGNLVINASQAMPEGGTVTLRLANRSVAPEDAARVEPGEYIEICVEDEGPGVPPEKQDRIFEPYYTTKETGTGLGLATAFTIVANHGGSLALDAEALHGARFAILLPASPSSRVETAAPAAGVRTATGRILAMDDDAALRELYAEVLAELGYTVETVADGREAVASFSSSRARGEPFDAVILDLTVPGGMGGLETAGQLRRIDPKVRAIAISGYSNDPVLADPASHGFAGRLAKPFTVQALDAEITRVLGEGATSAEVTSRPA